ncbi:MAG: hypothetical protein Q9181_007621, partial [Wetmoreana brouardii]
MAEGSSDQNPWWPKAPVTKGKSGQSTPSGEMLSQYQYTPLGPGDIRLIKLGRQEHTGDICCNFRNVNVDNLPVKYTDISYCWGSSDRVAEISCPDGRYLKITHAVDEVTHWLVDRRSGGYFWIDFLCIDQEDLEEKANQVAIMGTIFKRSERVDAWLGTEIDDGEAALDFLMRVKSAYDNQQTSNNSLLIWELRPRFPDVGKLKGLFQHPWFTRLWIVQEVVVAHGDVLL